MGERGLISYLIVVAFARKREWRLYWKLSHGHDHSRDKLANNTVECCGMNGCGIERVDFDWNSVNIQVPDLQPVVHDLLFSSIFESLQIASLFADSYEIRVIGPPVSCPRVYLSLLTTLLI